MDGTLGAGGHARGILEACAPDGRLLGLDVDPQALALARETLAPFGERARIVQASYETLAVQLDGLGWEAVDGVLLDLGASSMQFDRPERGFSFLQDGPLDMRFGPQASHSADELVNRLAQDELAALIYRYGEERDSRRIARAIVKARPLHTTRELAEVIRSAAPARGQRIHPATRTFQALRIAVNEELESVVQGVASGVRMLKPGGRIAIISFHSLEDRLVKDGFRSLSRGCICPRELPLCACGHRPEVKIITRKPVRAGEQEVALNPRARSARLRCAEKL